jgi:hypothetical protein
MIRYALKCQDRHDFESWFASADAFDALDRAGRIECPVCGTTRVAKALMAPGVGSAGETPALRDAPPSGSADTPLPSTTPAEQALRLLRREIEKRSDYVGTRFADEARKMHLGETPDRVIHGEAAPHEARALIDEGIQILPLPFRAGPKVN